VEPSVATLATCTGWYREQVSAVVPCPTCFSISSDPIWKQVEVHRHALASRLLRDRSPSTLLVPAGRPSAIKARLLPTDPPADDRPSVDVNTAGAFVATIGRVRCFSSRDLIDYLVAIPRPAIRWCRGRPTGVSAERASAWHSRSPIPSGRCAPGKSWREMRTIVSAVPVNDEPAGTGRAISLAFPRIPRLTPGETQLWRWSK
jgi:hypothetical protein